MSKAQHRMLDKIDGIKQKLTDQEYKDIVECIPKSIVKWKAVTIIAPMEFDHGVEKFTLVVRNDSLLKPDSYISLKDLKDLCPEALKESFYETLKLDCCPNNQHIKVYIVSVSSL